MGPPNQDLLDLLYFFDRFTNPLFMPKGLNQDVYFDIPNSYFPEQYKDLADSPIPPNATKIIKVNELKESIDLTLVQKCDKSDHFTLFNPLHQEAAGSLIKILLETTTEQLIDTCAKIIMSDVNTYLFEYALSVAMVHRDDTKFIPLPSPLAISPEFYLNIETMWAVENEASAISDPHKRNQIKLNPTATNMDPEHRMYYFREDIGINIHHWHWHVIYPFGVTGAANEMEIINKDRRGELFYYMHSQILARYNTERLCNRLNRAKSFFNFREKIPEPYFSKLYSPNTNTTWASRHANTKISDINRTPFKFKVLDLELYRDRILDSIHNGTLIEGNKQVPICPKKGIDILGNIVEASKLSKNTTYYGNLHNNGHIAVAYIHDPENTYLESNGAIGDNKTAMRDPMFYRWHSMIDDIFAEHKKTLGPYEKSELEFNDIEILNFRVTSQGDEKLHPNKSGHILVNELTTYTAVDQIDLAFGMHATYPGSVYLLFPHLQHKDFQYEITVKNNCDTDKVGTVRIFLAPTYDETERDDPAFEFEQQRRMAIELDKFVVKLPANQTVPVLQSSKNSSVTIPFEQMFMDINQVLKYIKDKDPQEASDLAFCGCGWPHHMLIPKGTAGGYRCKLFVMITDHDEDKVEGSELLPPSAEKWDCKKCAKEEGIKELDTATSFCGIRNKKYPDSRPMGFPFDRPPEMNVHTIEEFVKDYRNMKLADIIIRNKEDEIEGQTCCAKPLKSRKTIQVDF